MDIDTPPSMSSGVECIELLTKEYPNVVVTAMTVKEDIDTVLNAIGAGALGYVLKSTPPQKLLYYIKELYAGGSPMSPSIVRKIWQSFSVPKVDTKSYFNLTEREQEILMLVAEGMKEKEVAEHLHISLNTVKSHVYKMYQKLEVKNRIEAINKYRTYQLNLSSS